MRRMIFLCLLLAFSTAVTAGDDYEAEIDHLLQFVATSGCTFHRNGTDHSAADAADHLRLKYRRAGKYVGSAEQFIDRLASESSWTGKPYTVTCAGVTQPSGEWLYAALTTLRDPAVSH
ncbi:hypothetical protein FV139_01380 [Parahaliea maris]|uniref:DUF5329 domain-containing protein n=1 Tax=Parahaliea maris TaxID=2716870 RepID=A0A5C9A650_9GAMM|nr:DUF5329 domain-containing protein [Parahaliea maris]TXS96186.1 hypothetical protein FV139_01380 [Parahaliea maris]